MIKSLKSGFKYAKSFFVTPKNKNQNVWTSGMLVFHDGEKLCLDYSFIIIGNIPEHYFSYYVNFNNWAVVDGKLFYVGKYQEQPVEVHPENVYLYIKVGSTPLNKDDILNNPKYWQYYVSHPDDKIFNMIKYKFKYRIPKIIDLSFRFPYKNNKTVKTRSMNHPMFKCIRYFGDDRVIFSDIYHKNL